ncbi:hypothetical protein B9Z55_028548 [Caenorhabditis nigoni]|nr:hypothetical protein B9Z55_028548 [Caenorhabditis nigoni]
MKSQKLAKKFVLKHVFRNVANLKEDESSFSPTVKHFNMKWRTQIKRLGDYLEVYVICDPIDSSTDEWSIETKLEFKMIGHDGYSMTKSSKHRFETENEWISLDFMEWTRYLAHNGQTILLTIEVNVEIVKMTGVGKKNIREFDESQKDLSDVILVVKGNKFYVSKMLLAIQSSYFKALFFGQFDESQKSEIELNGIELEDFQNFLELIHGESSVYDDTVAGILHLADMYDAPTAIRRCEEFLLGKSKKTLKKKLQLATRYNLEKLKEKCMNEIKTVDDLRSSILLNNQIKTTLKPEKNFLVLDMMIF